MGRSRGFVTTLIQIDRAARQARAAQARNAERARRDVERIQRANERSRIAATKEQKRAYLDSRLAEVEGQNRELDQTVTALESILRSALGKTTRLDIDALKEPIVDEPFQPGPLATRTKKPDLATYLPPPPSWYARLVPGAKAHHELEANEGRQRYEAAAAAHAEAEKRRQMKLEESRAEHEAKVGENRRRVETQHAEVEELKRGFQEHSADAVGAYFTLVLERSDYPDRFTRSSEVTYEPPAKRLIVEMELPSFEIAPEVGIFKYVKSKDEIVESPRSVKERRALYSSVITQTALRSLYEVFSADEASQLVDTMFYKGFVQGVDLGTGQRARPCVVNVLASPDIFRALELSRVDPTACLHTLHGALSKSPDELIPAELALGLNVVDPRFIKREKA